jgi:hypothetical protein
MIGWTFACGTPVDVSTDHLGRVVWSCPRCAWQQAGRCWQCGVRRENQSPRKSLCDGCRAQRRTAATVRSHTSPCIKAKRRRYDAARHKTAERRAWRDAWRASNPDKIRAYKRKAALNPTPRRIEYQRQYNADPEVRAKKAAASLAKYYAAHPERPAPVCRDCGHAIPYTPPGRPNVRCDACVPPSIRRTRKTAVAA